MNKRLFLLSTILFGLIASPSFAQVKQFTPVTNEMLLKPSPNDWLMFSRTYDAHRFSPLDQINRQNVGQLRMVWARGMASGSQEAIPMVYGGVMYVIVPGPAVQALDATNGDLLWEYRRKVPEDMVKVIGEPRSRNLGIYEDMIYYATPDGFLVALDARTGTLRWETQTRNYKDIVRHNAGPLVADGIIVTGRSCDENRAGCFISAHDAKTGQELWKFYIPAGPGEAGGDTWASIPVEKRVGSPWGHTTYDPVRKLFYQGSGNPAPNARIKRHEGNPDAVPRSSPAELYTNSTVALDKDGKLRWYYQHVPGDDYNSDYAHERVLIRARMNPDRSAIKWVNPRIRPGQERDIVVTVGKNGGLWVNDRETGDFLWATPFPFDTALFHISRIDVETGKTFLNKVFEKDGDKYINCFTDAKGYWPMAYHPEKNSLYIPYSDYCTEFTANMKRSMGAEGKRIRRPDATAPEMQAGIAKVNMETGRIERIHKARAHGLGAVLATAGDLIFWGDINRRFKALDADTGKVLWESILGGMIQNSTITYAVNGKQYVAVMTGTGGFLSAGLLSQVPEIKSPRGHNEIYVFALPEQR